MYVSCVWSSFWCCFSPMDPLFCFLYFGHQQYIEMKKNALMFLGKQDKSNFFLWKKWIYPDNTGMIESLVVITLLLLLLFCWIKHDSFLGNKKNKRKNESLVDQLVIFVTPSTPFPMEKKKLSQFLWSKIKRKRKYKKNWISKQNNMRVSIIIILLSAPLNVSFTCIIIFILAQNCIWWPNPIQKKKIAIHGLDALLVIINNNHNYNTWIQ